MTAERERLDTQSIASAKSGQLWAWKEKSMQIGELLLRAQVDFGNGTQTILAPINIAIKHSILLGYETSSIDTAHVSPKLVFANFLSPNTMYGNGDADGVNLTINFPCPGPQFP